LVLLSGRATRLAPCFVGLDKRYLTEVDLTARTSTGDPEGEVLERLDPPDEVELERRLARLRGEVELPIPAASAVKIGGERAYKLARRGVTVEMPLRRSRVDALDVITYTGDSVTLDLRVSSGTYVRAIAEAVGGHCRTLRRTEVGPFSVDEADLDRLIPPDEALARLPAEAQAKVSERMREPA
jgi:tRNA pseudouridine55 synthase